MNAVEIKFKPRAKVEMAHLGALDDPLEWQSFSKLLDAVNERWESQFSIEGMHCAACAMNVEKIMKSFQGIVSAEVNAVSKTARVVWQSGQTKPSLWVKALNQANYQAYPVADMGVGQAQRRKEQRLALWRWLVAGFCMMQVMMYAYPTYTANAGEMTYDIQYLMRWAAWVLTLPVMLFSCKPFFSNAWRDIQYRNISMDTPVAIGIVITFVVSTAALFDATGWWGKEVYFDSLTMFVFFLLTGRWLEMRLREKTVGALEAMMRRLPESVERRNPDGSFTRVAVRRLLIGDVVRVLPGETFPADGRIVLGDTEVDEALLTGEAQAIAKPLHATVIAGSHNLSAAVDVLIEKIGKSTQFAQILELMERASHEKPRLAQIADRIAQPFLFGVIIAAIGAGVYWWPIDHGKALMAAVAVLIVTCPCALSLATPAAMLATAGALAKRGVLVRQLQALEVLANIDTVVFDKTGTLTNSQMKVAVAKVRSGLVNDDVLVLAASLAKYSLHPISRAIVDVTTGANYFIAQNVKEIPGGGLIGVVKDWQGVAESEIKLGSARHCSIDIEERMEQSALYIADESGWLATFSLQEAVRADAAKTVEMLHASGIDVHVLSGDKQRAVENIAQLVGIRHLHAECTPQDKWMIIKQLQTAGRHVVMVGDGLNDAPVLAGAEASIAVGQAVPLAQVQSDFVLLSEQLSSVTELIQRAKQTLKVVKQNLLWAAIYNAICVPLAVVGLLPAWLAGLGMAGSSLFVVINALRLSK